MDSQSPLKRPRTEDDPSALPFTRSKIWYYDGSIVLQAEQTQFRVHASLLSAGSTVFKDMFELARANVDAQVEGCPFVQLYDDKAEDVELVLAALYDRNFYKTQGKDFAQVAAMWRLGKKYEFDELRDDAKRRLECMFPTTLLEFQSRWYTHPHAPTSQIHPYAGLVFEVINLARDTGFLSILPAALYLACSTGVDHRVVQENILVGLPDERGGRIHLSTADKNLCILATSDLLRKQWELSYTWVPEVGRGCGTVQCRIVRDDFRDSLGPIHGMTALNPTSPPLKGRLSPCSRCLSLRNTGWVSGQAALWDQLPSIFNLPSWDEIKKEMLRYAQPVNSSCPSKFFREVSRSQPTHNSNTTFYSRQYNIFLEQPFCSMYSMTLLAQLTDPRRVSRLLKMPHLPS
ncbi:hypothetical protein B0H16DRAFT_1318164 [Mycena metata]|uniref:BTB domain-containing protein n=1 Tax=Mycena metata TaxID=1033252 RepID=A0AAD7IVM3_9AGAR|nr:hypothetical protein B0H16DRAFT_1318164 [Mycena metata]